MWTGLTARRRRVGGEAGVGAVAAPAASLITARDAAADAVPPFTTLAVTGEAEAAGLNLSLCSWTNELCKRTHTRPRLATSPHTRGYQGAQPAHTPQQVNFVAQLLCQRFSVCVRLAVRSSKGVQMHNFASQRPQQRAELCIHRMSRPTRIGLQNAHVPAATGSADAFASSR